MTDIRDAHPHSDGFEFLPRARPFGVSPDDEPYGDVAGWGPDDEVPRAPLTLDPLRRRSLAQALRTGLDGAGCDTTLRRTEAWAAREELPWGRLRYALEERGGFCDCEVLMNVLAPPDD